jgi:hypothetical protein
MEEEIPEIDFTKKRELKANWSFEREEDLRAMHGISGRQHKVNEALKEIVTGITRQKEWDEMMKKKFVSPDIFDFTGLINITSTV